MTAATIRWRFHSDRDRLMAEAHARPSIPAEAPMLVARIATVSGEGGAEADRAHMAALCRKLGAPEPGPAARWCMLDAGSWRLRWERHTELSTWTAQRRNREGDVVDFADTALDLAPRDWLGSLPGEVLAAAHVTLVRTVPANPIFESEDLIASDVAGGALRISTDFRPGPDGFTRFVAVQSHGDAVLAGRVLQQVLEIETYRLMAMLAFPVAQAAAGTISRLEAEAAAAAIEVTENGDAESDRRLLDRLAVMAGEAEALAGSNGFRFSAARAYQGLVRERIAQLGEHRSGDRPTLGEFMERRLAPAMRTCEATAERERDVIARIARTAQMLSTRVGVESEAINLRLLESMDRRARLQLRLEETVEGLSVAAISYYALGLLKYGVEGIATVRRDVDPTLATGLAAPAIVVLVWLFLRQMRRRIMRRDGERP